MLKFKRKRCPNGTHKNPKTGECESVKAQPDSVKAQPDSVKAQPDSVKAQPDSVKAQPDSVKAQPDSVKAQPNSVKAQPDSVKAQPDSVKAQPDSVKAQPDSVKAQPDSVKAQPDSVKAQPDSVKAQPDSVKGSPRSPQPVKPKRCPKGTRKNKKTGNCEPYSKVAKPNTVKTQTEIQPKIISIRSPENQLSLQVERLIMSGVPSYSPEVNKYIVRSLMRETPTDQVKYVSDCVTAKDFKQKIEGYPMIYVPKMRTCLLQNDISGLAKKALIEDLGVTTAKRIRIDPTKVIGPKQLHANCWFNTFFMCFFVSDKGRKFFRFFRELMITGERIIMNENGKPVRKKINKPTVLKALAWLNLGISASINGDPKAMVLDTNKIIERLSTSGIGYPKVKQYGNPIRAYTYLTNFLYPPDSSSARTSLNFVRIDQDFKGLSFEDNIKNERRFIKIKKIPDVLFVELYGERPNSGELIKKTEFILPETDIKYVLDSVVVRDLSANHFCCVVTINGEEWGFDGASFKKLGRFEWKKLINSNTQWTFDDLKALEYLGEQPSFFSFNPTDKMLKKHKPIKKGEYNPPHTIYFYYRQN